MFVRIPSRDAIHGFSELLNRAGYGRERFVLTRRGRGVAALVSIADLERLALDEKLVAADQHANHHQAATGPKEK